MGLVIAQIRFCTLRGENGSSQISHSNLLANRVFLRQCWSHPDSPWFLYRARDSELPCSFILFFLTPSPLRVREGGAEWACFLSASVCICLLFLACNCNQISESLRGHENDFSIFPCSCPSLWPPYSITPRLQHPAWPHELMTFRNYECCWPSERCRKIGRQK